MQTRIEWLKSLKIGDTVKLVAPSGASRELPITDVITDIFNREVIALGYYGQDGETTLPISFFQPK